MKQLLTLVVLTLFLSCQSGPSDMPYIGDREELDGSITVHSIRPYQLTNQLGESVNNESYKGKLQVVDFFFTSCPSICPKVASQMKRIQTHVDGYEDVILISHTLDPKRDTLSVLKRYADNIGADHELWHFLRGDKDLVMDLANEDYFVAAMEAPDAPGGYDHSGKILLLDKEARIRGFCDGTDPSSVDKFMKDIDKLRQSYE